MPPTHVVGWLALVYALGGILPLLLFRVYVRRLIASQTPLRTRLFSSSASATKQKKIVGFFHPYCNAGGGGERVLWTAIAHIQRTQSDLVCVVYSGDVDATKESILDKARSRMGIELDERTIHFVFLRGRGWVEDASWPRFTLLGQSMGSIVLAWEALSTLVPDLYIDTMGYAFTFPVLAAFSALAGRAVPIGAYVHYPTISTVMLDRVQTRKAGVTNSSTVASSSVLSTGKLWYYRGFMMLYTTSLHHASFLMTNSTWTNAHVHSVLAYHPPPLLALLSSCVLYACPFLLGLKSMVRRAYTPLKRTTLTTRIVYPPCDTKALAEFSLAEREPIVLSIAQFRPEKDHPTQLRSFALLLKQHPDLVQPDLRLGLVGGARNDPDYARVESLRALAASLDIADRVEFHVNASYPDMLDLLRRATAGIHTMADEHFGISVVELMAAGVLPVAHASAGPLMDIVVPTPDGRPTGFLASDDASFMEGMRAILAMPEEARRKMRERARQHAVEAFNEDVFTKSWDESGWQKWIVA